MPGKDVLGGSQQHRADAGVHGEWPPPPPLQEHHFTPEWEACEPRGKLVEADNWDGLATRVLRSLAVLGVPASKAVKDWLQSTYGELRAAGMVSVR